MADHRGAVTLESMQAVGLIEAHRLGFVMHVSRHQGSLYLELLEDYLHTTHVTTERREQQWLALPDDEPLLVGVRIVTTTGGGGGFSKITLAPNLPVRL
jgi:hypothetical protein